MADSFSVLITGIRNGVSEDSVIARVTRVFKLEESELEKLHGGGPVTVVSGVSETEAMKQKEILRRSGCVVDVIRVKGEFANDKPDTVREFKKAQEKLAVLLKKADKTTSSKKRTDTFALIMGISILVLFVAVWYFTAWYWALLMLVPAVIVLSVAVGAHNKGIARELFDVLKPGLIELVRERNAMGLAAISALQNTSVLTADRMLLDTLESQKALKAFMDETEKNRPSLYEGFSSLEETLKSIPELVNQKAVELKDRIDEAKALEDNLKRRLEEMEKGAALAEELRPRPNPCDIEAPGGGGFSYTPSADLYSACMLKEGQDDIILPPIDAGNMRYIQPASKKLLNSFDIGGGLTVAFTETHFIMALARSVCWRIGYDCVRVYRYSPQKGGEILPSGREHEMGFNIGLEHTYTDTVCNEISAFGFNITWWKIPGIADYCVPRIKDAIERAGVPRCPSCGGTNLAMGAWDVTTGMFSEERIPSNTANCLDCGVDMVYAYAAGGWMAANDKDMCRSAPPLSTNSEEMMEQARDILSRAENMIRVVSVARERFMAKTRSLQAERRNANLGLTLGNLRYFTMTPGQRNAHFAVKNALDRIPLVEYTQGVAALMFNFAVALDQIEKRLQEDALNGGEAGHLMERVIRCTSLINGFYASISPG